MRLIILILMLLLMPVTLAETQTLGTFKQNSCVTLLQNCADCSFVNITKVVYPNSSVALSNVEMTQDGTSFYYSFCDTSNKGTYFVNGFANPSNLTTVWTYNFVVTPTGESLEVSKAITYLVIFIFSLLIFMAFLIMGIALPAKNQTNEMTGYIIAVSNLKYFKIVCLGLAYSMTIFILYFSWMMSYAYLDMEFVSNILWTIFLALTILALPLFILFAYLMIANAVRDSKIADALSRGITYKDDD